MHFIPVHQFRGYAPFLGDQESSCVPVTDRVAGELLSLPLYPGLTDAQVQRVAACVVAAVQSASHTR